MRRVLCCILALAATTAAQSPRPDQAAIIAFDRLSTTLLALKDARLSRAFLTNQLVDEMMSLAPPDRRPSQTSAAAFADELTSALAGRILTTGQLNALQRSISDGLSGSGRNFNPAGLLRNTLTIIGVPQEKTKSIITRFIAVGEEVRGPDDLRLEYRAARMLP